MAVACKGFNGGRQDFLKYQFPLNGMGDGIYGKGVPLPIGKYLNWIILRRTMVQSVTSFLLRRMVKLPLKIHKFFVSNSIFPLRLCDTHWLVMVSDYRHRWGESWSPDHPPLHTPMLLRSACHFLVLSQQTGGQFHHIQWRSGRKNIQISQSIPL